MTTKNDILNEIRRATVENGGKPPGISSLRRATGISFFQISKFWPNYGMALKEAGYEPNEAWMRLPDDVLVAKTIDKIRKYGRYPTLGELYVDYNNGDDFPYHIFKKRKQPYIIKALLNHCTNRPGYEDIVEICQLINSRIASRESTGGAVESISGEVYLYKSGRYYKIGKTNDTVRRGNELRIQLPERVVLVHSIRTDDPSGVEAYWHNRFKLKRMSGEWFDLTSSDITSFKKWRKII